MALPAPIEVLLVDDEQEFVTALSQRLAQRGLAVTTVGSGADALARLEAGGALDVAVLDVGMPGMDGLETMRRIKERWPLMEVVMLTGRAAQIQAVHMTPYISQREREARIAAILAAD